MVEVADAGCGTIGVIRRANANASGGWGLRIVEPLADEWGVRAGGTRVWFRLGHDEAPAAD